MPRVHLKVKSGADDDNWLAGVSTDFSDAEFKILATHSIDNDVLELVEVTTPDGDAIVRRFDEAPKVRSYEVLHSDEEMVLIQYVFPTPSTYEARRATGNLPGLPLTIRDGWISGDAKNGVISSRPRVRHRQRRRVFQVLIRARSESWVPGCRSFTDSSSCVSRG